MIIDGLGLGRYPRLLSLNCMIKTTRYDRIVLLSAGTPGDKYIVCPKLNKKEPQPTIINLKKKHYTDTVYQVDGIRSERSKRRVPGSACRSTVDTVIN